jgi:putative cell wall-binding protein
MVFDWLYRERSRNGDKIALSTRKRKVLQEKRRLQTMERKRKRKKSKQRRQQSHISSQTFSIFSAPSADSKHFVYRGNVVPARVDYELGSLTILSSSGR